MPRILKNDLPPIEVSTETIGKNIATIRKEIGLTQKELADKIGINRNLVTDYELGRVRIYADMIVRIAFALNVKTDTLLDVEKGQSDHKKETELIDVRWIKKINLIKKLPLDDQRKVNTYIKDLIEKNKKVK